MGDMHPSQDRRATSHEDLDKPRATTPSTLRRLVNPHYFFAEMQFILTLMDIGERLISVPRETRRAFCSPPPPRPNVFPTLRAWLC